MHVRNLFIYVRNKCILDIYACQKYVHIRNIYACQKYMHIRNVYAYQEYIKWMSENCLCTSRNIYMLEMC